MIEAETGREDNADRLEAIGRNSEGRWAPGSVGPRIRWGEKLGAPRIWLIYRLIRAGFEPAVRVATAHEYRSPTFPNRRVGHPRRGSNPARDSSTGSQRLRRAEIFAPPILGSFRPFALSPFRLIAVSLTSRIP